MTAAQASAIGNIGSPTMPLNGRLPVADAESTAEESSPSVFGEIVAVSFYFDPKPVTTVWMVLATINASSQGEKFLM